MVPFSACQRHFWMLDMTGERMITTFFSEFTRIALCIGARLHLISPRSPPRGLFCISRSFASQSILTT